MSTQIIPIGGKFRIPVVRKGEAWLALRALARRTKLTNWFAFVDPNETYTATTHVSLRDLMAAFRWTVHEDAEGNIDVIEFGGDKLGDDRRVMDAIAPFVEDGSFVEFVEVDGGASTRWDFNGGQLQRSDGVRIP